MYDWLCQNIDGCFTCERLLKESARGRVELLRHRESGRRVICRRYHGSAEVYKKLLAVSSANLPKVLAVEEQDGGVIVLEEFISGDTLDMLLRDGLMNEAETRQIVSDVCAALWVLHSMGAVHRDVKPENIILSGGRTVLIDFDAARLQREDSGPDTQILGTMGYAAPEQFGLAQSDPRTDIYAVGVLINVMLTGEHPSKQLAPGRLRRVITRCTQISPEKRYPDISHLMEAIQPQRLERLRSMKKCPNCGAELPENSTLCPNCMADLADRSQVYPPKVRHRGWILAAVLAAAVLAVVLLVIFLPRGAGSGTLEGAQVPSSHEESTPPALDSGEDSAVPSISAVQDSASDIGENSPEEEPASTATEGVVYDNNSATLTYEDGGEQYTLVAHFGYTPDGPTSAPEPDFNVALGEGEVSDTLTMVTVLDSNGASAAEEFRAKVEDVRLEVANPDDNRGALYVKDWGVYEEFVNATYTGGLRMISADCSAGVAWVITMKNGDTLVLHQTIHLSSLRKTIYNNSNADLSDIDALKALLETIETELPTDMIVDIYLPPVRYEGGLTIVNHAVNLYGTNDGDAVTTFTGGLTVGTRAPAMPKFYGIRFEGSGGTGFFATRAANLYECVFTGWDTAVYVGDGSFVMSAGCTFEGNGIGIHYDSVNSDASSSCIPDNTFAGNGTAVLLDGIPMPGALAFSGCVFRQNGIDIDNPCGHQVDTTEANFEQT